MVFTEQGSLGLGLAPCDSCVGAEVLDVKAGTQAMHHQELRAGLIIRTVGGTSVAGMSYEEVTKVIIGHPERPLLVKFAQSSSAIVSDERIATLESEKTVLESLVAVSLESNNQVLAVQVGETRRSYARLQSALARGE